MLIQIIQNVGLLVFAILALHPLRATVAGPGRRRLEQVIVGLVLGIAGFIVSSLPIHVSDGSVVDGRAGPMVFAGFVGGPVAALIAAVIGGVARYLQGGPFALAGVYSYFGYAAAGAVYAAVLHRRGHAPTITVAHSAVLVLLCWLVVANAYWFIRPADAAGIWFRDHLLHTAGAVACAITVVAIALRFLLDSSENKRRAAHLSERLALAVGAVGLGFWDYDIATGKTAWNDEEYRLHGVDSETFDPVPDAWQSLLHPEDRARVVGLLTATIEQGDPLDTEFRIVTPAGDTRHLMAKGIVIRDRTGAPQRMVGFNYDLTALRTSERQTREAERRLATVARSIPGGLFRHRFHPDGREELEYLNPQCEEIFEMPAEAVFREPGRLLAMFHEDDRAEQRKVLLAAIDTLTPCVNEFRFITPAGRTKWLQGHAQPSRLDDGSVELSVLLLDATEKVRLEKAYSDSQALFFEAQKFDAVGKLTGGVAHDFNNLLAVILGNLELLGGKDDRKDRQLVGESIEACLRGGRLVQQLLAFSGQAVLRPRILDVNEVIDSSIRLLGRTLLETIRVEAVRNGPIPRVEVDSALLESAILNLALNARDAMPGGGRLTIGAATGRPGDGTREAAMAAGGDVSGDYVVISVSDTGEGMDEDTLGRAFEPFYTTKAAGAGSGLGLSMVHGFVTQSRGVVELQSAPGAGTTVRMCFPASCGEGPREEKVPSRTVAAMPAAEVLLVEDEESVRQVMRRVLEAQGHRVTECRNGDEGLATFRTAAFDLVVTDVVMPGRLQGPDLVDAVRRIRPDVPVILMSGYLQDPESAGGSARGANCVLVKPVRREDLSDAVSRALSGCDA